MIQLRLRTEYSFGQTFAPLKRMVKYLKEHGCVAAGIVDSNTWGHVAWFKACTEAGIQPLLGAECIVTDEVEGVATSMWFLATNTAALSELYKMLSLSHQQMALVKQGKVTQKRPRLYRGDVRGMSHGILKFAKQITDREFLEEVGAYADVSPGSDILNAKKKALGLPVVYTSDNAYIAPEDRGIFEVVAKAGTKPTPQHILLNLPTTPAMVEIVEKCRELTLPSAPMIKMDGDLEKLCREGITRRKMETIFATDDRYERRLVYELDIIRQKNYDSYFIVVADMVAYAKQHMLVGPSRGSAAGSLVCYLSGITEIDPIPPGLFFERFIDITRKDLPDIDLDFPDDKRQMVFDYMARKYGAKNVAHIGTVSKFAPRSALIQVCKAMDIPPSATAGVKAAMIKRSSADARAEACLMDTLTDTEPGRLFIEEYPHAAIAGLIEGHASHTGVHAAGLIICNEEVQNFATVDQHGIAHIEMKSVADLGLLKIDVLGLTTLSVLEQSGIAVDWYTLPLNDPKAYEVFNKGLFCGVFQFEGEAMRSISQQMTIEGIHDVDAVTALARPGPFAGGVTFRYLQRKKGEPYEAIHPLVQEHMANSYGLPIYQEQTLAICREIGNFGWKEAAIIRRAMSKSLGVEFFNQYWTMFKEGAATHGIDEETARQTWEMIMTMGSWQMNKAHTYSYAVISYWCAWLKGHHPLEFAASTLRNTMSEESAQDLLREMHKEGIEHVPFDPDLSEENWSAKEGKLIGGYTALKGIGPAFAKKYLTLRAKGMLSEKDRAHLRSLPNAFTHENLFPITKKYGNLYGEDYRWLNKYGIHGTVMKIDDILKHEVPAGKYVFIIGQLIKKNPHNVNEEPLVKKRGGKRFPNVPGEMEYLDVRLKDDTGTIGGRIDHRRYKKIGLPITEKVELGAEVVIRAQFYRDREGKFIPYAFISNWRRMDIPDAPWAAEVQR